LNDVIPSVFARTFLNALKSLGGNAEMLIVKQFRDLRGPYSARLPDNMLNEDTF